MAQSTLTLRWSTLAFRRLQDIGIYIAQYSPANARKVVDEIRNTARGLLQHPTAHPMEQFIQPNDGSYRYVLCYRYKIIYRIYETHILILDIFHSSRNPQDIQNLAGEE
jgi:plasmid stabilization system protein ParE